MFSLLKHLSSHTYVCRLYIVHIDKFLVQLHYQNKEVSLNSSMEKFLQSLYLVY